MGILLFCLLWGVVLVEEIERIPPEEWARNGLRNVWRLRQTRTRIAFLLALVLGLFFLCFELRLVFIGRSTFNLLQALAVAGILLGGFLYARQRKGPR